ncbi:uncharacterized protein LOC123684245 isoform X2 [Harmonia axyridis]|uniref:uncharacterized protein LOC123684245 isoform X2 n=1 Tax=Harmonia axyridis TaxID=115357 RepID=UPI001E2790C9|nr:uncharacterized protein LOC123684245 isoform X2 [Harmonia axyridis]
MNIFDCQLISNPSIDHTYTVDQPNFEAFHCQDVCSPHSESVNDSTASAQEVSSSPYGSTSLQKNPERKLQRAIYKGPDVFGKVLGPTADESILVGLQALMDMAGTLEFAGFTPSPSIHETPVETVCKECREVSEPISQSSASCQSPIPCKTEKVTCGSSPEAYSDECHHESFKELKKPPCQYIITQENIAAAVNARRSKCQHSQTRVLPTSMTCYNPDRVDCPGERNNVGCPSMATSRSPMQCNLRSVSPPRRRPRGISPPASSAPSGNCPCSQFYRQMTTISVLENSEEAPTCMPCTAKRSPCKVIEQPTIIFPRSVNACVETSPTPCLGKRSVASEPTKECSCKTIQTSPLPRPTLCNAKVETESMVSQEKPSVACDCNICMPISAGVSKPPSRIGSSVKFADEVGTQCMCSTCFCMKEKRQEKRAGRSEASSSVRRNKSCTCSLIPKGIRVADAAISSLKVNTSCQYHKSEIIPIETRSTQCEKRNHRRDSSMRLCSESGDCEPQRKKSVRILGGPYDCPDFSETRYCMEPKKSNSRSVIPLLDCNDDITKMCFEKPGRVCLEMGDSFIPPPMEIRYAITKITKFRDFSTFEVMKSTSKKPKCLPKAVEGVFVLKKEENYCSSKICE